MRAFREKLLSKSGKKSKVLHLIDKCSEWITGKRRSYMEKLTRNQSRIIFQTRTRMLKVTEIKKKVNGKSITHTKRKQNITPKRVKQNHRSSHND